MGTEPSTEKKALAALLSQVGESPVKLDEVVARHVSWEDFRDHVETLTGPSGFMLFGVLDHGAWLAKAGILGGATRVILGNPIIALTMLRQDISAGLFAPVELLVCEEDNGTSSVTYVRPSSLMVIDDNPPLLDAAQALDDKLDALVRRFVA